MTVTQSQLLNQRCFASSGQTNINNACKWDFCSTWLDLNQLLPVASWHKHRVQLQGEMCRTFPLNGAVNFLMEHNRMWSIYLFIYLTAAFLGSQRDSEMWETTEKMPQWITTGSLRYGAAGFFMHGTVDVSLWQAATTHLEVYCNISKFSSIKNCTHCVYLGFICRQILTLTFHSCRIAQISILKSNENATSLSTFSS